MDRQKEHSTLRRLLLHLACKGAQIRCWICRGRETSSPFSFTLVDERLAIIRFFSYLRPRPNGREGLCEQRLLLMSTWTGVRNMVACSTKFHINHAAIDERHFCSILDVRRIRRPNIDSDHYLVAHVSMQQKSASNYAKNVRHREIATAKDSRKIRFSPLTPVLREYYSTCRHARLV